MLQKLKKYFIPSEENDHRPHILRPQAIAFVCLVAIGMECVFLFGSAFIIPRIKLFGIIAVSALVDGTNQARVAAGVPALQENALLDAAAQEKANDMVAKNYFAHTSPAGITPWYWFYNAGYSFSSAGENLAVDFSDSADVTAAWLNSPEHRANIMNAGYADIGMATAQGTFEGHPAIYVVEFFAAPSPLAPVAFASPVSAAHAAAAPNVPHPVAPAPAASAQAATSVPTFTPASAIVLATATNAAPSGAQMAAARTELNAVQTAAADPRATIDYIYFAIALFFAVALGINIFVKVHIQHPQVILGGMLVILLVGLIIVLNQHFGVAVAII